MQTIMGMEKVKLKDLAREAGISISTASRVLKDSSGVSAATFQRAREAARKLGIDLDVQEESTVVAFLLSNRQMLHPFHARILLGAQAHLTASNCDTLFVPLSYSPNTSWSDIHLPKILRRSGGVRSAIVTGSNSENLLKALRTQGIHFAVLGNNVLGEYEKGCYDIVFSDDVGGAYEMTRHLQTLNHRDIWFVGNDRLPWFTRCYEGYAKAMENAGLVPCASGFDSESDQVAGYLGMKAILGRSEPATAIVSCTDAVALGVYKALAEHRIRIPDDISVVGCNDTYAPLLNPPLTTTCEFPEHLGKRLAEVVLRRMREPDRPPMEVTVPTQLIKRESCIKLALVSEQPQSLQRDAGPSLHHSI